jgi:N-dimethylarginine dimethylaminohydrolase
VEAPIINRTVLMTDAENFSVKELNLFSHEEIQPDIDWARYEHEMVKRALQNVGIEVIQVPSPEGCQDAIYTANWAFVSGDTAVMSRLPNVRQAEQPYAREVLRELGKRIIVPKWQRYSGQGDTLVAGDRMFLGSGYRSDKEMQKMLADEFKFRRDPKYDIIPVQTIPALDENGLPVRNKVSHWPDSYFYDIDLAMGVVTPDLIAWCPDAFTPESQDRIAALDIGQIIVDKDEAMKAFGCNFISTGRSAVMGTGAPKLKADIESHGLSTNALKIHQLIKGGGFIRCIALTLDNE